MDMNHDFFDDLIRYAQINFKFSILISAESQTNNIAENNLEEFVYGSHRMNSEELKLSDEERDYAPRLYEHTAKYVLVTQVDKVLQEMIGGDRFEHEDDNLRAASHIIRQLRNAFAHDPFNPRWKIRDERARNEIFSVKDIIELDTSNLNNTLLRNRQFGGPIALYRLTEFIREELFNK